MQAVDGECINDRQWIAQPFNAPDVFQAPGIVPVMQPKGEPQGNIGDGSI